METAMALAARASKMNAINVLGASMAQRLINPSTIISPWPPTDLNLLRFSSQSHPRNTLLTRCSVESNSSPFTQDPSNPISNRTFPPSVSCSGLVFDLGPEDSWDGGEIGSPVVKRFLSDDEERWCMWYHGRVRGNPSSDSIGLAVSSNGVHWERGGGVVQSSNDVGLVMNCSKDWWAFDTESIRPSEMVIMSSSKVKASSSVYWLYYTGYSSEKVSLENPKNLKNSEEMGKCLPGLAMSQDGRHWARIEGEHHSGALFDVGNEGEWDSKFIALSSVVFHEKGDLRMYYHSFDTKNGKFGIGVARSRDGMRWAKLGKIEMEGGGGESGSFDELGVMNCHVIRNKKDGKYVMVYEGVNGDGVRSIGLAYSLSGLKDWRRVKDEAILKKSDENGWDYEGIGMPYLVEMDGNGNGNGDEWRLYYRGNGNGGQTGIGMAVCQTSEIGSFRRWPGFHL